MLEDVYRYVRDMKLFRIRALSLAEALKAHQTEGAAALGYEALSADFYQVGKVLNNYLARVSKTIEEIPGADPDFENAPPPPESVSGEVERGAAPVDHLPPEPPTVVEKVIERDSEETLAKMADLEQALSEAHAKLNARKADANIPPPEIADLIRLNESYERTNERLVTEYAQAMQKAELARSRDGIFEGQSTTFWLRKAERYNSAIQWNRGRSVETL